MTAFQANAKANVETAARTLVREMLRSVPAGDARIEAIVLLGQSLKLAIGALAAA